MRFLIHLRLLLFIIWCADLSNLHAQTDFFPEYYRKNLGKLISPDLQEISGLVASRQYPGFFWVHNDSGDQARIFLIDKTAQLRLTCHLEGVTAIDCEEIAWVTLDGKNLLILADIGDNKANRSHITLYVLEEPEFDERALQVNISHSAIRQIKLTYPNGAKDAEALIVDPISKKLILFSKREFRSGIYTADFKEALQHTHARLRKEGELDFNFVTAADISMDGQQLLIKNLLDVYYWKLDSRRGWPASLRQPYVKLPYHAEPQGEAIGFDSNGESFYSLSERPFGLSSYLYQYNLEKYDEYH